MATKQPSWRGDKRSAHARGYTRAWQKARLLYLQANPLCVMCQAEGRVTAANVVDHIVPHKGDPALFWDSEGNWQSLCAPHHNGAKQMAEKSGRERAKFDSDGRVVW